MPGAKCGQPTKFSKEMQERASIAYKFGATDVQVAEVLGIDEKTLHNWKAKHTKYFQSVTEAKHFADSKVERSLYERANGYSHPEDKIFCTNGEVTVVPTRKHYPPDATSCIFWLKNRKPDEWRDLKNVDIQILTDDERMDRIDALLQGALDREVDELTRH